MPRLSSLQQFTRLCALGVGLVLGGDALGAADNSCERIVVTGNPDYPPLVWAPEGEKALTGVAIEMLQLALKDSGIRVDVLNLGSRAKALEAVEAGQVDVMAGLYLSRERLQTLDFVYPAIMDVPSVIFVRRGAAFPYSG